MTWKASLVFVALVLACGGSSDGSGGAAGLGGAGGTAGAGGDGGSGLSGWFWQNPLPQGNTLFGVSFIDATTGTAVALE